MEITIVPTTLELALQVAARVRPEDVAEFEAGSGMTAEEVLAFALRCGVLNFTGTVDGEPVCCFGVTPASMLGGIGCPWMVATPGLERIARRFARASRPVIDEMQAMFPVLINFVDNRNVKAIRWLGWLGFQVHKPAPHGRLGLPFRMFVRCSNAQA